MPDKRSSFLPMAFGLLVLAYALAFFIQVFQARSSAILYSFTLSWELLSAVGRLASWAPAILLVAAALSAERTEGSPSFHDVAYSVLTPAFIMAAVLSLLFLLAVPAAGSRAYWFAKASRDFNDYISSAQSSFDAGDYDGALDFLSRCKAIDRNEARYIALNDLVHKSRIEEANRLSRDVAGAGSAVPVSKVWVEANRFYLEALEARDKGRLFDAHYLAKRSLALYPGRRDVARLIEDTWAMMQSLEPTAQEKEDAAFYARKLEGYALLSSGDYLDSYRLYVQLQAIRPEDKDVNEYLSRSKAALDGVAFFLSEDAYAFSRETPRPLSLSTDGATTVLRAGDAVTSPSGVYLRNLFYQDNDHSLRASYARIRGDALYLRAVDDGDPAKVWEPVSADNWTGTPPAVLTLPFSEETAKRYLELSARPLDMSLMTLFGALDDSVALAIQSAAIRDELAKRLSYPFSAFILVILGTAFGLRFRSRESPGFLSTVFLAPVLVFLALPTLGAVSVLPRMLLAILDKALPAGAFIPSWLFSLGVAAVVSLLLAARIARNAPRP